MRTRGSETATVNPIGLRLRNDNGFARAVFAAVLEGAEPDELAGRFDFEDGEHFVAEFDDLLDERVPLERDRWREDLRRKILGIRRVAQQCAHDPANRLPQVRRAFAVIDRAETMLKHVEAPMNLLIDEVGGNSAVSPQPVMDRDYRTKMLAAIEECGATDPSSEFERKFLDFLASDEDGVPDMAQFFPPDPDKRPTLTRAISPGRGSCWTSPGNDSGRPRFVVCSIPVTSTLPCSTRSSTQSPPSSPSWASPPESFSASP